MVWLVKELDITKLGCPVAQPRFNRRPSARMITAWPSGKTHLSTCGLMFTRSMPGTLARPAMSISLSKCPMLPTIAWCFMRLMCSARDDALVAGRADEDVGGADHVLDGRHLVAVHRRLQGADRVDLGHDDTGALAGQRLGAALADVPVAADEGDLARR